jgi:hypothetical protein
VDDGPATSELRALEAVADRLDALAEVAQLMGDVDGAARMREQAAGRRMQALALLDR